MGNIKMINEVNSTKINSRIEKLETQKIINFIDGDGFDQLLSNILKGLFYGVVFFCIPYFIFIMFSL